MGIPNIKTESIDTPKPDYGFDPYRQYTNSRYRLHHNKYWRLYFDKNQVLSADDDNFWPIVEMLDLKPWEAAPEPAPDYLPEWDEKEEDTNFVPSYLGDHETGITGNIKNAFPGYRKIIKAIA